HDTPVLPDPLHLNMCLAPLMRQSARYFARRMQFFVGVLDLPRGWLRASKPFPCANTVIPFPSARGHCSNAKMRFQSFFMLNVRRPTWMRCDPHTRDVTVPTVFLPRCIAPG